MRISAALERSAALKRLPPPWLRRRRCSERCDEIGQGCGASRLVRAAKSWSAVGIHLGPAQGVSWNGVRHCLLSSGHRHRRRVSKEVTHADYSSFARGRGGSHVRHDRCLPCPKWRAGQRARTEDAGQGQGLHSRSAGSVRICAGPTDAAEGQQGARARSVGIRARSPGLNQWARDPKRHHLFDQHQESLTPLWVRHA